MTQKDFSSKALAGAFQVEKPESEIAEGSISGTPFWRVTWNTAIGTEKSNCTALSHIYLSVEPTAKECVAYRAAVAELDAATAGMAWGEARVLKTKTGARSITGFYKPGQSCSSRFAKAILASNAQKQKRDEKRPALAGKWSDK